MFFCFLGGIMIVIREEIFTTLHDLKTSDYYRKPLPPTVLKEILLKFYPGCFLGGAINEKNILTFHHIEPLRNPFSSAKELDTLENGSLLGRLEHDIYNLLEDNDIKSAKTLKEFFLYYKETIDNNEQEKMKIYIYEKIDELGYEINEDNYIYRLVKQKSNKKGS